MASRTFTQRPLTSFDSVPVQGISPRHGWSLCDAGDGSRAERFYQAVHETGEVINLQLSRWNFTPTQARWNWIVDAGFPVASSMRYAIGYGPWGDDCIDALMARAVAA